MADVLYEIMRWLHLASMATLIGGMIFARLVMARALEGVAPDARESLVDRVAGLYKPFVYTAIGGLVVSGSYNLLTNPGHRPLYHMLLGVKLLLALHVFAVAILIVQPKNPRRVRMMTGLVISGLTIIAISAWLRHIF
jgi:putative copper export protein